MSRKNVPAKTSEGMLEIKVRRLGLAPRIRTALLLVDGVKSTAELERLMAAAGVTAGALQLLLDKGLIHFPDEGQQDVAPVAVPGDAMLPHAMRTPVEPGTTAKEAPTQVITPNATFEPIAAEMAVESASADVTPTALEVVTLGKLETILGDVSKLEMEAILGVATMLELAPPLAQVAPDRRPAAAVQKTVVPASVLRMNLIVARAHLANILDQFLGVDGYLLKQNVVACESRAELEKLFRLVEGALIQKMDKAAAARAMEIAQALLER